MDSVESNATSDGPVEPSGSGHSLTTNLLSPSPRALKGDMDLMKRGVTGRLPIRLTPALLLDNVIKHTIELLGVMDREEYRAKMDPAELVKTTWLTFLDYITQKIPQHLRRDVLEELKHAASSYESHNPELSTPMPSKIQLVNLHPPNNESLIIRCTFHQATLQETSDVRYEALLYAPEDTDALTSAIIEVDGKPRSVTATLHSALRHLRHPLEVRTLLVDALCMVDSDPEGQVCPAFHTVLEQANLAYSQAKKTVIWLGSESISSKEAFEFLQEFVNTLHASLESPEATGSIQLKRLVHRPEYFSSWNAISHILRRKWWDLAEFHQALMAGSSVSVQCGSESTDWQNFTELFSVLARISKFLAEPAMMLVSNQDPGERSELEKTKSLFIGDSFRMPAGLAEVMKVAPSTFPDFIQGEAAGRDKSTFSTTTVRQAFSLFEKAWIKRKGDILQGLKSQGYDTDSPPVRMMTVFAETFRRNETNLQLLLSALESIKDLDQQNQGSKVSTSASGSSDDKKEKHPVTRHATIKTAPSQDIICEHLHEDADVTLHQLCETCANFPEPTSLLQKTSEWMKGQPFKEHEEVDLCSFSQLKAGYLAGCHVCGIIWTIGNGRALEPRAEPRVDPRVVLRLSPVVSHYVGEDLPFKVTNYLYMYVLDPTTGGSIKGGESVYFYPDSYPGLKDMKLEVCHGAKTISSKTDKNLEVVRTWFDGCCNGHDKCDTFSKSIRGVDIQPSRLLDLANGKVSLECNTDKIENLQYTTLSHMWGDPSKTLQLKADRLEEFKEEIPSKDLPAKYQDAVRITRFMGFRYLWIDSLCIIQGCAEDWKKEATKMASIYGGSSLNISGLSHSQDASNRTHLRDPRTMFPCIIPPPSPDSPSSRTHGLLISPREVNTTYASEKPPIWNGESLLLTRAWVHQERLLCPRNIFIGNATLVWECCEDVQDEFMGEVKLGWGTKAQFWNVTLGDYSTVHAHPFAPELISGFLMQWPYLVDEYRKAELSFESDRIVAFLGIAKAISTRSGLRYLAGLWMETVEFDLLWSVTTPQGRDAKLEFPSWSWFCVPPRYAGRYNELEWYTSRSGRGHREYISYRAEAVSFYHPTAAADPESLFNSFKGMRLTLKTVRQPAELRWTGFRIGLWVNGRPPKMTRLSYFHDDPQLDEGCKLPSPVSMMLVLVSEWYLGLVITPCEDGTWRRVGYFQSKREGVLPPPPLAFDLRDAREELITLV